MGRAVGIWVFEAFGAGDGNAEGAGVRLRFAVSAGDGLVDEDGPAGARDVGGAVNESSPLCTEAADA